MKHLVAIAVSLSLVGPWSTNASADVSSADAVSTKPVSQTAKGHHSSGYCERNLGQWFYCETPEPASEEQPAKDKAPPSPADHLAAAEAYSKRLEELGKIASWNPTRENVEAYIRFQRIGLDKASLFSDHYQRLIWTTPDLNYENQRPMMQAAKSDFDDTHKSDRDMFLRKVSEDIGVYYVFAGHCAACRTASPIYSNFANRFGVTVRPISTDGAINSYFPKTLQNRGQLEAWGVNPKITPALILYQSFTKPDASGKSSPIPVLSIEGREYSLQPCNQPSGCVTYLASGVISVEDAADRIFSLLAKEPGSEF